MVRRLAIELAVYAVLMFAYSAVVLPLAQRSTALAVSQQPTRVRCALFGIDYGSRRTSRCGHGVPARSAADRALGVRASVHFPIADVMIDPLLLAGIGFTVTVLGGCFGVGGVSALAL